MNVSLKRLRWLQKRICACALETTNAQVRSDRFKLEAASTKG